MRHRSVLPPPWRGAPPRGCGAGTCTDTGTRTAAVARRLTRRVLSTGLAALLLLVLLTPLGARPVRATVFGNPVNELPQDTIGAGLRLSNNRLGTLLDYGLPGDGAGRLLVGSAAVDGEYGPEFGLGYRQKLWRFPVAAYRVRMGALVLYREGVVSSGDVDANTAQLDVGFGGRVTFAEKVRGYALGIYNQARTRRVREDRDDRLSYVSQLGAAVGGEWLLGNRALLGAEVHLGLPNDPVGVYALVTF